MSSTAFKDDVSKGALQITAYSILFSISFSHMLNDTMQSLIPSIYPLLKNSFNLNFAQIGLIQLTFQLTASILQPVVGTFTDKRPQPFSLAIGMCFTLIGLIFISFANSYAAILVSVALIGTGSSIFHPESSKIAFLASGGRRGFAQSVFQVGGNLGTAIGPLLAASVIVRFGRSHAGYFGILALLAIAILIYVGRWAKPRMLRLRAEKRKGNLKEYHSALTKRQVHVSVAILLILIFSKYFYLTSLTSYYTFYLIHIFHVSVASAQVHLFLFLFAVAAGTFIGGPLGDRFGRKYVIWISILGVSPFTIALPYANLMWTSILTVPIGVILASAFSAILVYAQNLLPGKIGMVAGLFFGLAFGMAGIGSAILGKLADLTSISYVFHVCSYLPLIGLLTGFLPNIEISGDISQEE